MKGCSASLASREIQIKNHNEIPLHTSENGHHKQNNKQQVLERMRRKGNPSTLLVGIQTGAATEENNMEFPRKLKMELPLDPMIPLLGLYPKNPKTPIQKNLCTPMFIAAQFTIAKYGKQSKCPSVNEWIKKTVVHLHSGILCSRDKEGAPTLCNSMDGTGDYYANEINQVVKDKYHMISPLRGT